jgi:DNA-binding response OmpR family regulator
MSTTPHEHNHEKLCVLVVEDSPLLRDIFRKALRGRFAIYAASGAKEGWRLYEDKKPDIVFVDIGLPDGSGHDLTRKIKEHSSATYIVMATANDSIEEKETASHNHADGYIEKPFNMQEIEACIERCIALKERGQLLPP